MIRIIFYPISSRYGREAFDGMSFSEAMNMLVAEGRVYAYDFSVMEDVYRFETDYSDELLDDGMWCAVFTK